MSIPEGDYCYNIRLFSTSVECPHYDGTIPMKPKCAKYRKLLAWSVSGHVLKCPGCNEVKR